MAFRDALARIFGEPHPHPVAVDYDRTHWRKKLARILEELPDSQSEWDTLMSEARSLDFDKAWVQASLMQEFDLLIRRAVADRVLTGLEHRKLDLARDLVGLSEQEAEAHLQRIVAEAQSLFGKPIQGA